MVSLGPLHGTTIIEKGFVKLRHIARLVKPERMAHSRLQKTNGEIKSLVTAVCAVSTFMALY